MNSVEGHKPSPVEAAYDQWRRCCLESGWHPGPEAEVVSLGEAVGRVTAYPVHAAWSSPAEERAAMDGIAVNASETTAATEEVPVRLGASAFDIVDTGDPIPADRDAVIMREHVRRGPGDTVEIVAPVQPGRHVRGIGEDVTRGELLLSAGHRIRPVDAAVAAGAGHSALPVATRPVVAVVPTGDEVKPIGSALAPGDVLDTNSLMLAEFARDLGCAPHVTSVVPDDPAALASALRAAAERSDLVLVIAGSSAGRDDHTAGVLATLGKVAVHGVAMRPGHPVVLGVIDLPAPVPVIGVPGYPVAAAQIFRSFAAPIIGELQGRACELPDTVYATATQDITSPHHLQDHVLVQLRQDDGELTAVAIGRGAGVLSALMRADGILSIPSGVNRVAAGQKALVELLRH
jgi:putative molybdopterin biosynthesis protein